MSTRQDGYRIINVSTGVFSTVDEARKEADSIKARTERRCRRKGYTCEVIIGVSANNPHTGEITTEKTGKRGRPRKAFVRTNGTMQPAKTEPHIHIIIHAEPAETVAREIAASLNKKYGKGKRIAWVKNCGSYIKTAVRYVLKQSIKIRTTNCKNGDICHSPCTDLFSFTLSNNAAAEENAEISGVSAMQTDSAELLYKAVRIYNFSDINTTLPVIIFDKTKTFLPFCYNLSFFPLTRKPSPSILNSSTPLKQELPP